MMTIINSRCAQSLPTGANIIDGIYRNIFTSMQKQLEDEIKVMVKLPSRSDRFPEPSLSTLIAHP